MRRFTCLLLLVWGLPASGQELPGGGPRSVSDDGGAVRDPLRTTAAIDEQISARLAEHRIRASPQAEDAEFLRRVFLDLTGKLPTADRAAQFLDSEDADKRRHLIDELLASPDYGRHFSIVWQNLILPDQNDIHFQGLAGFEGIKEFGRWLADAFNSNSPWDAVVGELITAEGTIQENPAVAYTMSNMEKALVRPDFLGVSTARLFLGVQLQCVECHDHFYNEWKQQDFWGLAAFFGRTRFELPAPIRPGAGRITDGQESRRSRFKIDGPTITIPDTGGNKGAGTVVRAKYLSGPEPTLDESGPYRASLARWITSDDNPYFAPAAVNRLWGHLFARGLVHPVDDMHAGWPAAHPEVLELLAQEFRASRYDLKHLLRCICNSQVYQRSSRATDDNAGDLLLGSHMSVKVMSPDVLYDALLQVLELQQIELDLPETLRTLLPPPDRARLRFMRFFQVRQAEADEFALGVPHVLSLMNSDVLNSETPAVRRTSQLSSEQALERLYLATLSRRPTDGELKLMQDYLDEQSGRSSAERYADVLWILLNSSEFVINH